MAYMTRIKGNYLLNKETKYVLVKKFGETVTQALTLYSHFPKTSITYFAEHADVFIKAISRAQQMENRWKIKSNKEAQNCSHTS